MASEITNYQCPACTAPLRFDGESGKLTCDFCGSTYEVPEIETLYAEKDKALMLIDEIHSRGFEICGDYICEVIVELPIFKQDQRNMFYKIEIPVVSK